MARYRAAAAALALAALVAGCTPSGDVNGIELSTPASASPSDGQIVAPPQAAFGRPSVVVAVLHSAEVGVEAANTFDYRHLDADLRHAKPFLTKSYGAKLADAYDQTRAHLIAIKSVQKTFVLSKGLTVLGAKGRNAKVLVVGRITTQTAGSVLQVQQLNSSVSLTLVKGHWLIDGQDTTPSVVKTGPGSALLVDAYAAARTNLVDLFTYSRQNFDHDFQRALDFTTGTEGAALTAARATAQSELNDQAYDAGAS